MEEEVTCSWNRTLVAVVARAMEFVDSAPNCITHPFGNAVTVVQDELKGRCMMANKEYHVGDVIFIENALIYASCDDDIDLTERTAHAFLSRFNPKITLKAVEKFTVALSNDDLVGSLDTARCFLQGLCLAIETTQAMTSGDFSNMSPDELLKIELLKQLQPSKLEDFISIIKKLRRQHKSIIPSSISDSIAGHLLGALPEA